MATEITPHASPIYLLNKNRDIETVEAEVISMSLDLTKFKTLKDFSNELEKYARSNKKQMPQKKKKLSHFSYMPSSGFVPQQLIFAALRKCLANKTFWSSKGLQVLLENSYITPGFDDGLIFECILKYKSYASLKLIAKSFDVVGEQYILKTLKSILNCVVVDEAKPLHKKLYTTDCPVADSIIVDLSYAMLLPVNKMLLKEYLKLLTLNEALILLQCFNFMLHLVSPALVKGPLNCKLFDEGMTENRVVMWLDLLVAAHLMAFATSHTLQSLIPEMRLFVRKQQYYYSHISQLASLLSYIREGKTIEKPIGQYTIETITM